MILALILSIGASFYAYTKFDCCSLKKKAKSMSATNRTPDNQVDPIFTERWSQRAMSGEKISHKEKMSLFEASRWAPSSYNDQPWSFIYVERETSAWDKMFNLLVDFNKSWCANAGMLILVVSRNTFSFNGQPMRTHSFDTGAACENLALQGSIDGLVVHGMEGFDYDKARKEFNIPSNYTIEAMFAVGKPAGKEVLPEALQPQEVPSGRKSVSEFVFEGQFKGA